MIFYGSITDKDKKNKNPKVSADSVLLGHTNFLLETFLWNLPELFSCYTNPIEENWAVSRMHPTGSLVKIRGALWNVRLACKRAFLRAIANVKYSLQEAEGSHSWI